MCVVGAPGGIIRSGHRHRVTAMCSAPRVFFCENNAESARVSLQNLTRYKSKGTYRRRRAGGGERPLYVPPHSFEFLVGQESGRARILALLEPTAVPFSGQTTWS